MHTYIILILIFRSGRMLAVGLSQGPLHHYFYVFLDRFAPGILDFICTLGQEVVIFRSLEVSGSVLCIELPAVRRTQHVNIGLNFLN